jgi:site-specific DNA-methyltransferase (adenine-specific)
LNPTYEVFTGDCIEVMRKMRDGTVRLAVSDPPYNASLYYGDHYDDARPDREYRLWCRRWMREVHRLLTPDGSFVLVINHENGWKLCSEAVEGVGFRLHQVITWLETFGVNYTNMFNKTTIPIFWFAKGEKVAFNREAVTRPSDRLLKYHDRRANPAGKCFDDAWLYLPPCEPADGGDLWRVPRLPGNARERLPEARIKGVDGGTRQLPQLPLKLLTPIVACFSDPGDLVLDPHVGTGTTGAACLPLGRRFVGIELSPETAAIARDRLDRTTAGLLGRTESSES